MNDKKDNTTQNTITKGISKLSNSIDCRTEEIVRIKDSLIDLRQMLSVVLSKDSASGCCDGFGDKSVNPEVESLMFYEIENLKDKIDGTMYNEISEIFGIIDNIKFRLNI